MSTPGPSVMADPAEKTSTTGETPLQQLAAKLNGIFEKTQYREMYGVELRVPEEGHELSPSTQIILQKFLRANANDVDKAASQLTASLSWRKDFQPLKVRDEIFDPARFSGLGYVTTLAAVPGSPNASDIVTFNVYGAVKNTKATFGDLHGFIKWRVALMERTVQALAIDKADKGPVPGYGQGPDPYQAIQVHDYLSVSFLRQPAEVKAASKETIQLFQQVYPETMSKKYFVNVPLVMQWMIGAMQMLMSKETAGKMHWMSYGSELHKYLGPSVPKAYGGNGPELEGSGQTPRYSGQESSKAGEAAAERPAQIAPAEDQSTAST